MKHNFASLVLGSLIIFSSCNKDSSSQTTDVLKSSNSLPQSNITIPLTHQQLINFDGLMAQGKIENSSDFLAAVNLIKSTAAGNSVAKVEATANQPMGATAADYSNAYDDANDAVLIGDTQNEFGGEDPGTMTRIVYSRFQTIIKFPIRTNSMQVIVPFQYNWGHLADVGTNTITNISSFLPIQLLPGGGNWGEVTPGSTWYINAGGSTDEYQRSMGINAYANAQEKRSEIYSTNGQVEISANANLAAFQVGGKIGAGFIIARAVNIYNQYSMTASGQINIETMSYGGYSTPPNTNFQGSIECVDFGILQNQ